MRRQLQPLPGAVMPSRGLLQGGAYTRAVDTNVRVTFQRVLAQTQAAWLNNVKPINRGSLK
jgi:hypothetical protein